MHGGGFESSPCARTPTVLIFIGNPPVAPTDTRSALLLHFVDTCASRAGSRNSELQPKRRNKNQICREQRRASLAAPGGLDRRTDARSKALSTGITAYNRIERVRGWRGG